MDCCFVIIYKQKQSFLYALNESPLAFLGESSRGTLIEELVKQYILNEDPDGYDVLPAAVDNGRNASNTKTDFRLRDKKTGCIRSFEVKSARLGFDKHMQCWCLQWRNVKLGVADRVVLVFEDFDRLQIFMLDTDAAGYSTAGVNEAKHGGSITVYGKSGVVNPYLSYNSLIKKLASRYVYVDNPLLHDDPLTSTIASWSTRGADAMAEMPLSMLSGTSRGEAASLLVSGLVGGEVLRVARALLIGCCGDGRAGRSPRGWRGGR